MDNRAEDLDKSEKDSFRVVSSPQGFNLDNLITRIKNVFLDPKGCWEEIKNEPLELKGLYMNYLIWLALIPAVCGLIGMSFFGISLPIIGSIRIPFSAAFANQLASFVNVLIMIFLGAQVVSYFAPRFGGNSSVLNGAKLWGFAMVPAAVAGVFQLIPSLAFLGVLVSLYGLYVYYQGITPMTEVPEDRRFGFAAASIIVTVIAAAVLFVIIGMFTPALYPQPDFSGMVGEDSMRNLEEAAKQLEKFMPKAQ